jgi:hypothetical protein
MTTWRGRLLATSFLTALSSPLRIVAWFAASFLTFGLVARWFYERLWRKEPFSGTGMVTPRDRLEAQLEPNEVKRHAYYEATNQYAWHAADVIPFVNATKTLNWTEPSTHWKAGGDASAGYSHGTGILLVIYKLLVLAPVLAAARVAWQLARARRDASA